MERTARTFELIVETSERLVVNRQRRSIVVMCPTCGQMTQMLTPEDAAAVTNQSARDLYRGIESGHVHFTEQSTGELFICIDSLREGLL